MAVTLITQKELLKLAELSCITLEMDEVEPLRQSLEAVLAYASRLKDTAAQYPEHTQAPTLGNTFREDTAVLCDEPIVTYAAYHENNYFVVPVIIKQS